MHCSVASCRLLRCAPLTWPIAGQVTASPLSAVPWLCQAASMAASAALQLWRWH